MLAYTCGNLDAYNMMTEKILSTFKNLDLASSKEHAMHGMEITFNLWSLLPSLLELGQFENIQSESILKNTCYMTLHVFS